jgi:ElaB/YqjD/DUF883 family membrane-anchored ribosome-binding protein
MAVPLGLRPAPRADDFRPLAGSRYRAAMERLGAAWVYRANLDVGCDMARDASDMDRLLQEIAALKDSVAALARERASDAGERVRKAANGASAFAAETSDEAMEAVRDTIREHPLTSVASAFAFGLSVARLLRH